MPDAAWKASERAIGKRLGGVRAGPTGREGPDVVHPLFAPEVKSRREVAVWLKDWIGQAVRNAPAGKLPLVIIHETGQRHDSDLVVMRLKDFEEWGGLVTRALGQEG